MDPNKIDCDYRVRIMDDARIHRVRAVASYCPDPPKCEPCKRHKRRVKHYEVRLDDDTAHAQSGHVYRWITREVVTESLGKRG